MKKRAQVFSSHLMQRRSVRDFSDRLIPEGVLEACLGSAVTAPNGANLQPWHFSVIRDPKIKKAIREAAEEEEKQFYNSRAPKEWLDSLAPIGTNAKKPFLENAPALVAIFQKSEITSPDGTLSRTYYSKESVGIATGFLISSLHHAGLATLTHTPSPMKFLNEILARPISEKPFLLLVVGFPAPDCHVPDISRLPTEKMVEFH
ncbi:MAG: nitroreductase family protein [Akkermansiaceae bacterium]|nr:nitroreductase family protein [Akkermansiaceae bacterium]MDG1365371.1 nitroreductase family protein [Akkermansiaceae bacterium]